MESDDSLGLPLPHDQLPQEANLQHIRWPPQWPISETSEETPTKALSDLPTLKLPVGASKRRSLRRSTWLRDTSVVPPVKKDQESQYPIWSSDGDRSKSVSLVEGLATVPTKALRNGGGTHREANLRLEDLDTIPTMVLKGIASQQGTSLPVMQSEISGAANGAAIVGVGNITSTILKYGTNFLIQRGFGAALYGLYSLSFALVSLIAAILDFGLDNAMNRYIAIYRSRRQANLLRGLTIFCTSIAATMGILGALVLLVFAPWLPIARKDPELVLLVRVMAPMVPLLCMQVVWLGGLQGFKAFSQKVLSERLLPSTALLLLLGGVLLFYHNMTGVALATLISTVISSAFALYFLLRLLSRTAKQEPRYYELPTWLGFAVPNFLTSITEVITESIAMLLLGFFAIPNLEIGRYAISSKISDAILMPLASLNAMFAPSIAELHSNAEQAKLKIMFQIVTKWTIVFSLPLFFIVTLFSQSLLGLSGPSFIGAWPILTILSFGCMINAGTGSVGYMLLMTGHQKLSLLDSLLAVAMNVVLGAILTSHYSAIGTAICVALTVAVTNVLKLLQVHFILKMLPYRWDTLKPLGAGLISCALTGCLLFLLRDTCILIQLSLIPVFLAGYVGLLILFKASPEDKIVVDALRRKVLRSKR